MAPRLYPPRAYIASPIFTPEQLEKVGEVEALLDEVGYHAYSPRREGIMLAPDAPAEERDKVYWSNFYAVTSADVLVAILDNKDTGTTWEMGCAAATGVKIVAVTLDIPRMNVMLERGVIAHVKSLPQLRGLLKALVPLLSYGRVVASRALEQAAFDEIRDALPYLGETQ